MDEEEPLTPKKESKSSSQKEAIKPPKRTKVGDISSEGKEDAEEKEFDASRWAYKVPFPSFHSDFRSEEKEFPTRWFEIPNVKAPEKPLRAPRFRLGSQRYQRFLLDENESTGKDGSALEQKEDEKTRGGFCDFLCGCCCRRKMEEKHETAVEGLEALETVNLSYQELSDEYQVTHFLYVLKSLRNVRTLVLCDNLIYDLKGISFPTLETLFLSRNEFTSFKDLPTCPKLVVLNLSDNHIRDLHGLKKFSKLESIHLVGNPIADLHDYRTRVKRGAPSSLKYLDGMPV
eukprot:TRINITY_DN1249_c0_g1_i4.p1 TRINITY_DN1249_c0_g1~~TRINITY_DN1249_c0_g1_i4.p1  ORF type:complete len:320 (+),score=67.09 TRINITY_DN1249_c0_g1_i4:99-962(+)